MAATLRARANRQRPQPLRDPEVWRRAGLGTGACHHTGQMRVLLTGAAGFIGTAVRVVSGRWSRGGRARRVHPEGARVAGEPPRRSPARRAASGQWAVARRGRRRVPPAAMVGAGSRRPTCRCTPATTTSARRPARGDGERGVGPRARQLDGRLRRGPLRMSRARRPGADGAQPRAGRVVSSRTSARTASATGLELVDEDARLDPRSSYAASKVAQEHYALAWARQSACRSSG